MPSEHHHRGPAAAEVSRRRGPISLLVAGAVVVYACGDAPTGPGFGPPPPEATPALAVEGPSLSAAPLRICGEAAVVPILHPEGFDLGHVTVTNDQDDLSVLFESHGEWELLATHLGLADSPEGFPMNRGGLPQPGQFPHTELHTQGVTAFAFSIPLAGLGLASGDDVLVAPHVEVIDRNDPSDPEDDQIEGGWGDGTPFSTRPKGNVGRYFEYVIQNCASVAQTVGAEGGDVVVGGTGSTQRATLEIPPGALPDGPPVVITVSAIPLSEIPLPGSGLTTFITGTAYDFGPDGLEFLVPVLLTIGYDEAALGGEPESSLAIFRVTDGIERIAGSSVDEEGNQVSVFVEHFTVYVTGTDDGIAMVVEEAVGVADEVTINVRSAIEAAVAEAIGVGDEVTINVRPLLRASVLEAVGVGDQVTINVLSATDVDVAEAVGVGDEVTVNVLSAIDVDVAEAVGVADEVAINVLSAIAADVVEAIGVGDEVTINVLSAIDADVAEAVGVGDEVSITVVPTATADLAVVSASVSPNPVNIGSPVTTRATVQNLGPDDVLDATVHYRAFGDVTVGPLSPGCTETAAPEVGDAEVVCPVPPLEIGRTGTASALAPAAVFVPQSAGTVTVRIVPDAPAADPDASNDEFVTSFVAARLTDLQVVTLVDSRDPVQEDADVTYTAQVRANVSTPVDGATVRFLFTGGDATFLFGDAGCAAIVGGVECALGTLAAFINTPVQVTMDLPTGGQTITVQATIAPAPGVTDTNPANNSLSTTTTVVTRPPTQLAYGDIVEGALLTPPDTLRFGFDAVAGDVVRVQVWMLTAFNASTQLIITDPGGGEIYPDGAPGGRATGRSSAYDVFTAAFTGRYGIKLTPGNGGLYRLGLGTGTGRLDASFGSEGTGVVKGPRASSPSDPMYEGAVLGDAVLAIGEGELRRYDENGEPDAGFGSGGAVDMNAVLGASRYGQALVVQPDGMIVVAARQTVAPHPWIVARFGANGVLDPSFGIGGIVEIPFGTVLASTPLGIGLQQNGADLDIVVGGNAGTPSANVGIARLNPDGSLDTGFGTGGIVNESGGFTFTPREFSMQSDGSVLLTDTEQIRRYTPSGARDASFGTDGLVVYSGVTTARAIYVQPDDRILVLGDQSGDAFAMRLTADGVLDGTFAGGGLQFYDFGLSEQFLGATTDGSGDLIVVGRQATPEGDFEFLVTRMSAAGVLDLDFATAGYLTELRVDEARWVAIDASGRIIVGGQEEAALHGMQITRHLPN